MNDNENQKDVTPSSNSPVDNTSENKNQAALGKDNIVEIKEETSSIIEENPVSDIIVTEPSVKEKSPNKKTLIIISAIIVLVAILVFFAIKSFRQISSKPDSLNVETIVDGVFKETGTVTITGLGDFTIEQVSKNFKIEPSVEYVLEKSGNDFILKLSQFRNIAYAGSFTYETSDGKTKQEVFKINGPSLTVTLEQNEIEMYEPITLKFSEQVDARSFEENFKLVPETKYEISYDLDYITIHPEDQWQLTSQYQLTIDAEYASKTGKEFAYNQAFSFVIVKPESEGGGRYYPELIYNNDDNFIITDDVEMALNFTGMGLEKEVPIVIEAYRLGDVDKFKSQSMIYLDYDVKLDPLEKISTNAFAAQNGENRFKIANPGLGSYIVRGLYTDPNDSTKAIEVRTGYLVTPISLYMQSSKNETLAWLHDSKLGGPVEGYTVMFGGDETRSNKTDKDGITLISHPVVENLEENEEDYYNYGSPRDTEVTEVSIFDKTQKLVYYDNAKLRKSSGNIMELYYSYLFIDRTIYRPEDTISFWGFAKPFRTNKKEMPKTARVVLDPGGLDMTVEVPVNENGIFSGEIKLEQIKSSQYTIESSLIFPADKESQEKNDTQVTLDYQYISVKEFQKPSYVIETSVDKEYYGSEDTVKVNVIPKFYDGTPVPNFELEAFYREDNYGNWKQLPNITTNEKGEASFSFKIPNSKEQYTNALSLDSNNYRVQIASDGENIVKVGSYDYLFSDKMVEQKITKQPDGKNIALEVNSYKINLTNPEFIKAYKEAVESEDYYARYDLFSSENLLKYAKGEPVDMSVDLELRWRYTDTKSIEHANRQYNPKDSYVFDNSYSLDYELLPAFDKEIIDDWETHEKRITVKTVDGKTTINDLIYLPEGSEIDFSKEVVCRSYATFVDSYNHLYRTSYFYPSSSEFYDWSYSSPDEETDAKKGFTFKITDKATGKDLTPTSNYYRSVTMDINSPVNFQLMFNGEPVDKNGTILYTIIQGGLYEHKTVNANEFDLSYLIDFSPSAQLVCAYFDGSRTHYINDLDLQANEESLKINIEITPDKDSYRPGETAKLKIKSTDFKGNPVAGNLCISVVDESIFALSEQYLDSVYSLYNEVWYLDNYVSKYCTTYRSGGANSGLWSGGKGDGDGSEFYDSYRSNFKDTAKFIPTRTDENGNANVDFVLPDNTTSWRITAVEIGDKLLAGDTKTNIISTLPFFVKPVTSSKYIDGDEISMLVQGHGIALDETSEIKYTVTLTGDKFEQTLTSSGKAYSPIEFNFGKLPMGTYKLQSKAEFSGYSDTVELPINVIKSNLELVVNTPIEIPLNKPLDIKALRYPVSLSFYSEENLPFFESINSLFGHYCMMPSQRLSRFTAKRVLRDSVVNDEIPYYISRGNDSVADMQQGDGGIGEEVDSSSDLILSTYLTLIAKDQFNQKTLSDYFNSQISSAKNDKARASAYLGLAALGQTKSSVILNQLGLDEKGKEVTKKDISLDAKAYYIAALAYLDEKDLATKLYNSELKSHISDIEKHSKNNYEYNQPQLNWERDTAAIWVAASKIDQTDADRISTHFGQHSWRYRTLFEAMIYVTNYSRPIENLPYTYTLNGETITKDIGLSGMSTLVLSKSDIESIRFTKIPAELKSFAYYVGEPIELNIKPSENMSVTKEVTAIDKNTYKVTLKLELSENAPSGVYNISDWIPSNSRLYQKHKTNYNSSNYSYMTTENQKVYIDFHHNTSGKHTEMISYTIRQTYSAEAMLDTVYVIHGESGENCNSEKTLFIPENSNSTIPVVHIDPNKNTSAKPANEVSTEKK